MTLLLHLLWIAGNVLAVVYLAARLLGRRR
jgi:hypothetical protein